MTAKMTRPLSVAEIRRSVRWVCSPGAHRHYKEEGRRRIIQWIRISAGRGSYKYAHWVVNDEYQKVSLVLRKKNEKK